MFIHRLACALSTFSLGVCALAQEPGPIPTRNHRAIALAFLRFVPVGGKLAAGRSEIEFSATSANDFRSLPGLLEDEETERLSVRYRKGARWGEWMIEAPFLARGGGFLDPIIIGWHEKVLHWVDPGRKEAPSGRSIVQGPGYGPFGSRAGLGDASLFASRASGRWSGWTGLKLPTGNARRLLGSGGVDAGAWATWTGALGHRWHAQVYLGGVAQSRDHYLKHTRGLVDQAGICLWWRHNSRDTWNVQWQSESAPIQTGVAGADATHRVVTFGYQRLLRPGALAFASFSEDRDLFSGKFPEGANIGPDFTIQLGLRLALR